MDPESKIHEITLRRKPRNYTNGLLPTALLFKNDIVDDYGPALKPTFLASHTNRYRRQLLKYISFEVQNRCPLRLDEGV